MRDWTPEYDAARALWKRGVGRAHGMGAGGVGMAALLELLRARGFSASGCDTSENRLTAWLAARGIPVAAGHDSAHADAAEWLIHTTAVPSDHPELRRARERNIPVTPRGIALAARMSAGHTIAVSGTHGKTTTTSLLAQILRACGIDTSFAIGGEVAPLGGVAGAGRSGRAWLVAEADESDGTLAWYAPEVLLVNNIDFDHMEHFRDVGEFHDVFARAMRRSRGAVIYGWEDPAARRLASSASDAIAFGFGRGAQVRAGPLRLDSGAQ
nr:UDP-N-acetylmuramate--alanine ligase [Kiritimatiellia bacterium]